MTALRLPRVVEFVVFGIPTPKARARVVRRRDGSIGSYTPDATRDYEQAVRLAARIANAIRSDGPVGLDVVARWPYPVSWSKRSVAEAREHEALGRFVPKATRPDVDNVAKAIADALNDVAYADDGQIAQLRAAKCWGPVAETRIRIWQGDAPEWCAWWMRGPAHEAAEAVGMGS